MNKKRYVYSTTMGNTRTVVTWTPDGWLVTKYLTKFSDTGGAAISMIVIEDKAHVIDPAAFRGHQEDPIREGY